ncbi:unnamed protein product [Echinostoma caproni]|uniref:Equilibrative nucleoside transporter 1 n=1 Tax=Echinostoma caproni TaxID=27848 RepID=A0A183A9E6_9TREM|nr:unnamed protein product [Echinostoma caproni]
MGRSSDVDDEEATNSEFNRGRSGSGDYTAGKFPPMDKYKLVYIIFFISGVGTLLPWNFFITAIPVRSETFYNYFQYFQYKLRNQSLDTESYLDPKNMTREQRLFGSYLAVCSMVPLATFNIIGLVIMKCLFLNQQPRTRLPVVFHHDAFPILVVILLGLSNGYLMTLAMMYGPSFARPGGGEGAGVALSIYIALGLAVGVAVSAGLAQAI